MTLVLSAFAESGVKADTCIIQPVWGKVHVDKTRYYGYVTFEDSAI